MIGIARGGLALFLTYPVFMASLPLSRRGRKNSAYEWRLGDRRKRHAARVDRSPCGSPRSGSGVGVALAFALLRALASAMVFMQVFDAVAFIGGVSVVILATLGAGYVPSRRAAAVDPLDTLRYD